MKKCQGEEGFVLQGKIKKKQKSVVQKGMVKSKTKEISCPIV